MVLISDKIPEIPTEECSVVVLHLATKGHEEPDNRRTLIPVTVGNVRCNLTAHVMMRMNDDVILGSLFLRQEKAIIVYYRGCIYLGASNNLLESAGPRDDQPSQATEFGAGAPARSCYKSFKISSNPGWQQPTTRTTEHNFRLRDDAPINKPCFGMAPAKKQIFYQQVDEMIRTGVIAPSTSAYSSPSVGREEKDPKFCIVYRLLNDRTVGESSALIKIQGAIKAIAQAKYFYGTGP